MSMISVIVPVYNTRQYLSDCIESILSQTYSSFELLLIDDGSTDESYKLCCSFAEKDSRIRVFQQENEGVTSARRKGIENAKGEFVCFVDSDDTITVDAFATLLDKMTDAIDVVISDSRFEQIITGVDFLNKLLVRDLPVSLWGKLYRKRLFEHSDVMDMGNEIYMGEDYLTNMQLTFYANRVYCISEHIYQYRDTPLSVSHTRKYYLEYEEIFRKQVEKIVVDRQQIGLELAWYRFQLNLLKGLIVNKITFSYDTPWIKELLNKRVKGKIARKERIVAIVHNPTLCRFIFCLADKMILVLNKFYEWRM